MLEYLDGPYVETVEWETINWGDQYALDTALNRWSIVAHYDDSLPEPKQVFPANYEVFGWDDCTYIVLTLGDRWTIMDISTWTDWHTGNN